MSTKQMYRVGNPTDEDALLYCLDVYKKKKPSHANFLFFESLKDSDGLFLDIGAHAGQTVAFLAHVLTGAHFVSFEPNPLFTQCADLLRAELGSRLTWHHVALGDREHETTLHIPEVPAEVAYKPTTATPLGPSSRASLLERQLEKKSVRDSLVRHRHGAETTFRTVPATVKILDSFELAPRWVKIDVEGYELNVLRGMTRTLRHKPVVMIEKNEYSEVIQFMDAQGFRAYSYIPGDVPSITSFAEKPDVNDIFFLHQDTAESFIANETTLRRV